MDKAIFLPVAALVALTYRGQVTPGDFRYGELFYVALWCCW